MMPREAYSLLSDLEIAVQRSLYFLTQKVKFTIIVFAQQTVWCRTLLGQFKRCDTSKGAKMTATVQSFWHLLTRTF